MQHPFPLSMMQPGQEATVVEIQSGYGLQRRLAAMGLNPGVRVRMLQNGSLGPLLVLLRDTRLALGRGMAQKVLVQMVPW